MHLSRLAVLAVSAVGAAAVLQEVTSLPGLSQTLCFKHWSGYAKASDKQLFTWVVEAETSPETKPVVLWLNGGPGCSSLGGMWTELGPFVVDKDQKVTLNPYAWNKVATMIFVEQPAGVGFSFPAQDTNDTITADDTYQALLDIFASLPQLQGRPFYVFGESYGGHYVPNTVKAVQDGNKALPANDSQIINIKGFGVGNGYTDWALDFEMNVPYGRAHALCSAQEAAEAVKSCNGTTVNCFWPRPGFQCTDECNKAVSAATDNAMGGGLDIYDIYEDMCLDGKVRVKNQAFMLAQARHRARSAIEGVSATPISPIYATCEESFASTYLSREDVQRAIHAQRLKEWNMCGLVNQGTPDKLDGEGKTYHFNFESRLDYYRAWLNEGKLDMLIYSGDADYILNFMCTENWLKALNLPVTKDYVAWKGSDKQVAGYLTEYEGMRFATVKGAGHMVPKDRPRHALDLFSAFLVGTHIDAIPASSVAPLCSAQVAVLV